MPLAETRVRSVYRVTTAGEVPPTRGELEGDDALETLRRTGRRRLLVDSIVRFRAADGFSHSRALAFQFTLTLLPALIAVVGLAAALGQEDFTEVVRDMIRDLAPGATGEILTEALRQGTESGHESGETALAAGGLAALVAGTSAMGQVERGANRIYGVERDRPFARKYLVGLGLALTAGLFAMLSLVVLMGGAAIRDTLDLGETFDAIWRIARWPLGLRFAVASVALLFEYSPRRRQPEASWLAFGAGVSVVLWLVFMGVLAAYMDATDTFGATYGPIAGTIGVLLWTFFTSVALFLGLAFAAQLEAVRAGVPEPRIEPQAGDARREQQVVEERRRQAWLEQGAVEASGAGGSRGRRTPARPTARPAGRPTPRACGSPIRTGSPRAPRRSRGRPRSRRRGRGPTARPG